jgi:hypothetical protein
MLQLFINGIFGADTYQRGSTVLCTLLEVKVPPFLNIIKGNCCPVESQAGKEGSIVIALPKFDSYARREWVASYNNLPIFP